MIAGLPLDYAHARLSAHLARRPDERLWSRARSARTTSALLEALRASPAAGKVSGIDARAGADEIERAFRQQLRLRIMEVARWAPQAWRGAVLWTRHLVDLPALVHLFSEEAPAPWMRGDPALADLARATPGERRAELVQGELAPLAGALRGTPGTVGSAPQALHAVLAAWRREWRRRWPRCDADARGELVTLERAVAEHLARFAGVPLDQTAETRGALTARALRFVHRFPAQPVALFAYLIVAALDVERLRGEFSLRTLEVRP